jgi:nicotinate-nucleotide pyrophosphorylase (carboxylating)
MNKNTLIQKHFQKAHLLKMTNPKYQKTVNTLFNWLVTCDQIKKDQTSLVIARSEATKQSLPINTIASIKSHQDIVVAGIEEVEYLLKKYPEITFQKKVNDGERLKIGQEIAIISGSSGIILSLERMVLNILQRMSGIATQTQKFAQILDPIRIAATRKTPWMQLDKKAVAVGGGLTHRLDLSDGILIKDNHLQILKNENNLKDEEEAITYALKMILPKITNESIEIEVTTKEAAFATIKIFSQIGNTNSLTIMLDNWSVIDAQNFIKEVSTNPNATSIIFEASGNINESNLQDWAQTGVDIISSGALTHSVKAADLSLSIK